MPVVTSTTNSAVKAARKLAARRGRTRGNAFLVEGPQAVGEAVNHLHRLFVTPRALARERELVSRATRDGVDIVRVTEDVLAQIADTVTPQGMVGVATLPSFVLADVLEAATLLIVGVEVADPGNAGTIIRTADAAGADAVVLTTGSVDACNPKAVRASAGSLFHLPVLGGVNFAAVAAGCRERGLSLVAAHPRAQMLYTEVDLNAPTALVFGSEAHGLASEVLAACDIAVRVPLHERTGASRLPTNIVSVERPRGGRPSQDPKGEGLRPGMGSAESLNLATTAAIVMYEAVRQRSVGAVGQSFVGESRQTSPRQAGGPEPGFPRGSRSEPWEHPR